MMHTLMTGASGWFGKATLRLLEDSVLEPGLLVRTSSSDPAASLSVVLGPGASAALRARWSVHAVVYIGDLTDPMFVDTLPIPDRLLHAAANIHPRPRLPRPFNATHPGFTSNVSMFQLLLAHIGPIVPVLLVSSVAAAQADMGYARSKLECEGLLRNLPTRPSAVCRAAWFAGPDAPPHHRRFDRLAAAGWFPGFRHSPRRSVSYVDDVVRASVAAFDFASFPPPVFSVASVPTLTFYETLSIRAHIGKPRRIKLPTWFGALLRAADRFVLSHGGYSRYLHVLAELSQDWAFDDSSVLASRELLSLGPSLPPDTVVWLERNL